jgi:hypothetical protein
MQKPEDVPPANAYGPWWRRVLVLLSVIAALVITALTGVGVGIVLGVVLVADTAGIVAVTIVRAHRHNESFRAAAAAVLVGEHGRWRLEERAHHDTDHADPGR